MAWETGTASDHEDLYEKLLDFLQNNEDLVNDGQNWELVWEAPGGAANETDVVLKGPGLAGSDEVFVGMSLVTDPDLDSYAVHLHGFTGVFQSATALADHQNPSPRVGFWLDTNPFDYWFVANGRRFMVVLKISTVYEAAYAGLFLPFATPVAYPYPLFVGGSFGESIQSTPNWRSTHDCHRHFVYPWAEYSPSQTWGSAAKMLNPLGTWMDVASRRSNASSATRQIADIGPESFGASAYNAERDRAPGIPGYDAWRKGLMANLDGSYPLTPFTLLTRDGNDAAFGTLHGCHHVPGQGNSAENIVTIDGVDHLVVQNAFRTSVGDYWAIALE